MCLYNIFAILLLGSSGVQLLKVRAYKQQVFITDQNEVADRLRLHVSAYTQEVMITGQQIKNKSRPLPKDRTTTAKPAPSPIQMLKPLTVKPVGEAPTESASSPVKPIQKPVNPSTKPPTMKPNGGGGTQYDWYCGNRTANTCSLPLQKCTDPTIGCPENDNNRDCMNECIPKPSAKPMKNAKPTLPPTLPPL